MLTCFARQKEELMMQSTFCNWTKLTRQQQALTNNKAEFQAENKMLANLASRVS